MSPNPEVEQEAHDTSDQGQGGAPQYYVNFSPELTEIITETKYLEQLGFMVPELARNVALQEEKFSRYVDGLKRMLARYYDALSLLNAAEMQLLDDHIKDLQRVLRAGYKRLNWNSLGIPDFIGRCSHAIGMFNNLTVF